MSLLGQKFGVSGDHGLFGTTGSVIIELTSGLITLLGPNGTGKSRVLEKIGESLGRMGLPGDSIRLLAAGRTAPIENFRVKVTGSHGRSSEVHLGNRSWRRQGSETIAGDVMALMERKDLLLKVQCRLEQLFGRRVILTWGQSGIDVAFVSKHAKDAYSAVTEATGLLQLLGLMAALYDDETKALLVDEPELGLHPQLQSFVLQEAIDVCGDPLNQPGRKLVIFATHSPSMVRVEKARDLASIYFFTDYLSVPVQLAADAAILSKADARGLIARLGEAYKLAFFAQTVLLVEGPSDRVMVSGLSRRVGAMLATSGVEIVPIIGNGDLPIAVELFSALGKRVIVLTDLDTVIDGTELVESLRRVGEADEIAQRIAHSSFKAAFKNSRDELFAVVEEDWNGIATLAEKHPYWTQRERGKDSVEEAKIDRMARRRAAAASLLSISKESADALPARWQAVRRQLAAVLELAEHAGMVVLRRGRIEDYYIKASRSRKPSAAAEETETLNGQGVVQIEEKYRDILRAIQLACTTRPVDEVKAVRSAIAGVASRALLQMTETTTQEELSRLVADDPYSSMLTLSNASEEGTIKLTVALSSSLFEIEGLPITIAKNEPLDRLEREIKQSKLK